MFGTVVRLTMVSLALLLFASLPSQAEEIRFNSIGIRGGVTESSPIGEKESEYFHQNDLMANWSLPWGWYSQSGWGVGTRLMGSVGAVMASGIPHLSARWFPGLYSRRKEAGFHWKSEGEA
ncbi:MAG: hypothetical protein JW395_1372 [Nitrospira sp.]|nr:hypothetical protein [Nitrospira sp.]